MMKFTSPLIFVLTLAFSGCSSTPTVVPVPAPIARAAAADTAPTSKKTAPATPEAVNVKFADFAKSEIKHDPHAKADPNGMMTCSNSEETRTLSVAPKEGGCELIYEKNGQLMVPAYSAHGTAHCFNAREKIRTRLLSSGYKCSL